MTDSEQTYRSLLDMGIDDNLAKEASRRYVRNIEAAADWCFGAGMNWKPEPVTNLTKYPEANAKVEHHEVMSPSRSASPRLEPGHTPPALPPRRLPPTPAYARPVIGSNNPFYSATQNASVPEQDDEDEELQRAIRMSQGGVDGEDTHMGERDERERSVRATAPPPSPDPERLKSLDEEGEVMGTLFGPSTKEEEGASAMIAFSGGNKPSKEDEDLDRAIQDSLMTASFHSASAPQIEKPKPTPRQGGAPLIFLSESGDATYAAHFLQAMYAIPQIRETIIDVVLQYVIKDARSQEEMLRFKDLQRLFKAGSSEIVSFVEVDDLLDKIRNRKPASQLPPVPHMTDLLGNFGNFVESAIQSHIRADPSVKERGGIWEEPQLLIHSLLEPPQPSGPPFFVQLFRNPDIPYTIGANLASVLWPYDTPNQSIKEVGEVMCVFLGWGAGAQRKVWELEKRVVLDRFMYDNLAWATQIRAQEAVSKGNIRRLRERIDHLTTFQGNNFQDSLSTIIKHYEAESTPPADEITRTTQSELKAKLEKTLQLLTAKTEALSQELQAEEAKVNGKMFDTEDPRYNQHGYKLYAILMHDGALVAGKHLYAYVMGEGERWWKVEDHECTEVAWEAITKDQTGIYMDGGPYCLLYARESPRPPKPQASPADDPATIPTSTTQTPEGSAPVEEGRGQPESEDVEMKEEVDLIDLGGVDEAAAVQTGANDSVTTLATSMEVGEKKEV